MDTPSRITTVPGVAFDSDPMLEGAAAAGAAGGTEAEPMGAIGVAVAWATTTGATPLSAVPAVEGVDACGSVMAASVTKDGLQGQLACRICTDRVPPRQALRNLLIRMVFSLQARRSRRFARVIAEVFSRFVT